MLKKSGAKYTILYASQPSGLLESPSNLPLGRYLAEEQYGECLVKSTLLEGTFVVSCYLYSVSFVVSSIMKCRLMCETILHKSIYLVSLQYCLTPFFLWGILSHTCLLCSGNSASYHLDIRTHVYDGNWYSIKVWSSTGILIHFNADQTDSLMRQKDYGCQYLLVCAVNIVSFLFKVPCVFYITYPYEDLAELLHAFA